jgi:hypothetical protein
MNNLRRYREIVSVCNFLRNGGQFLKLFSFAIAVTLCTLVRCGVGHFCAFLSSRAVMLEACNISAEDEVVYRNKTV